MKKILALVLALMMVVPMVAMAETVNSPVASPDAGVVPSPDAGNTGSGSGAVPSPDAGKPGVPSPDAGKPGVPSPDSGKPGFPGGFPGFPGMDSFTSASVANYYADFALVGDALMEAVNSTSGTYIICTTNPDGSANAGVFIFAIKKLNDKYYIQLGLAENQTLANLNNNGEGLAVYAANPTGDKPYIVSGARFYFEAIKDASVLAELKKDASESALFFEITEILPLG